MFIDENKYNTLFISKFKAHDTELKSELNRVKHQFGESDEIKLKFYQTLFQNLINQFINDLPKDENYDYIIITLYTYFIKALKEDGIDTANYDSDLAKFKEAELLKLNSIQNDRSIYVPEYKKFNLNTKYGRRKAREQAARNYENGTPQYRNEIDKIKIVVWIIIILISIVVFLIRAALS